MINLLLNVAENFDYTGSDEKIVHVSNKDSVGSLRQKNSDNRGPNEFFVHPVLEFDDYVTSSNSI
jgi:hypothetical protein